jgi:replicative DNA helicase
VATDKGGDEVSDARPTLERALLSAALCGHEVVAEIEAAYGGSPFRERESVRLWGILQRLAEKRLPFDVNLLAGEFIQAGGDLVFFESVGYHDFERPHIPHYCDKLRELAAREGAKTLGAKLLKDPEPDVDAYITQLDELRQRNQAELTTQADAIQQADDARANPQAIHPTRIRPLDDLLKGGLRAGQLIVVGGRPGSGKSVLMLQMLLGSVSAAQAGLVVSLEMLARELIERLRTRYNPQQLAALNLRYIDNTSSLSAIQALVNVTARRMKLCGVAIDYLQLLEVPGNGRDSREREIAKASRQMKRLALDLQIPVIVGSQLNRDSEKRGKPGLHDLRESGAIEQDADIVILLHRDGETGKTSAEVAKHRGGSTGRLDLQLDGPRFQFVVEDRHSEYDDFRGGR